MSGQAATFDLPELIDTIITTSDTHTNICGLNVTLLIVLFPLDFFFGTFINSCRR